MAQSPNIEKNSDLGIFDFRKTGQSLENEICHNSRTSNGIDMKLKPVSELQRETQQCQKKLTVTSCREIVTSSSFFGFMTNLFPGAGSVILVFLLLVTFYLTKTEKITKKYLTQLSYNCLK